MVRNTLTGLTGRKKKAVLPWLCIFAAAFCSFNESKAQVGEPRSAVAVGVTGGVALNSVGFDPTIKQKLHVGPTLGVVARFTSEKYFNSLCSLQLELNYSSLGWNEEVLNGNSEPLPDTYQRHFHYLQFPMLARLAWGYEKNGGMGYILAGPQVGYCIAEASERSDVWTLTSAGNPDRPNGMYAQYDMSLKNKFDYGITAGAGFELNTKIGHFLIEGRYYYGLGDLFGNSKKDVFARSNNGTIVAKITYLFDVKK